MLFARFYGHGPIYGWQVLWFIGVCLLMLPLAAVIVARMEQIRKK